MSGRENTAEMTKKPDFIINQSTATALTVLEGSGPSDAKIGLAYCSGRTEQQWLHDGDYLLWGGNPSYCLVPSRNRITLGDAATSAIGWSQDEASRFIPEGGEKAMEAPWTSHMTSVILSGTHDGTNQKWWTLSALEASLDGLSPVQYPFKANEEDTYKQESARTICNWGAQPTEPLPYKRDVATFPGLVSDDTPRVNRNLTLNLSVLGQRPNVFVSTPDDWQATNLYIPADEMFEIVLPETLSSERAKQIKVNVGAHVDKLLPTSSNVSKVGEFRRMPVVSESFDVFPGVNQLRSQFGGNLIFMFSEGENFLVDVEIRNVVEAPYFKLGKTTIEEWKEEVEKDAPFAILENASMLNETSGFDEEDPAPRGKFWLVNDLQITAGSAHSGNPLMFMQKHYDLVDLETPHNWVISHELGHNYQQYFQWAGAYDYQATASLYSLYIQDILYKKDRLEKEGYYNKAADVVDAGKKFEELGVFERLVFLMEIKWAFPDKDWDMFTKLRKISRALPEQELDALTASKQKQFDHVYKTLSKIVGSDLINTYNRWGLKISKEAQDEIEALGLPKAPGDLSHRT